MRKPNRLIHEKSPYLLQHALNPVAWFPWGEEAFSSARSQQKPIFLSVGYSTCHWCHVMERESFENDSVADLLNRYFVAIKVDREERPDVDKVYMTALQGMGQNGGWPMSMFLTPDLKPFYGGTYFPPHSQRGQIGFPDLLDRIRLMWASDREKILRTAGEIAGALQGVPGRSPGSDLDPGLIDVCCAQLERIYDPAFGGFGGPPKFPRPSVFDALLRHYARTGSQGTLDMIARTLEKMSEGGIYDHIGGGFHRYAVDGEWRVPHFEKMLYDQAQLVVSYLDLFRITKEAHLAEVAREVLEYVLRDMTHPDGGFFSAEDADSPRPASPSEDGEGAFYVWSKKEILSLLPPGDADLFCFSYGLEDDGNALLDPHQEFAGKNILYIAHTRKECEEAFGKSADDVTQALLRSRQRLFTVRSGRPRPRLDDKILTSWNGLMISAFAQGYQVLKDERYRESARRSAGFIMRHLADTDSGRLRRRYRDGEAKYEGNLEDYAFLSQGFLDLYEATLDAEWIRQAVKLAEVQIDLFWDSRSGGFFDTSGSDPSLLVRTKEEYDGAEPTGNSVAAMNLLRLAEITGGRDLRERAEQTLLAVGEVLQKQPAAMPRMVAAFDFSISHTQQIVLASPKGDPRGQAMLDQVYSRYLPNRILVLLDSAESQRLLAGMSSFYGSFPLEREGAKAYVCQDYTCQLPTSSIEAFARLLDQKKDNEGA